MRQSTQTSKQNTKQLVRNFGFGNQTTNMQE